MKQIEEAAEISQVVDICFGVKDPQELTVLEKMTDLRIEYKRLKMEDSMPPNAKKQKLQRIEAKFDQLKLQLEGLEESKLECDSNQNYSSIQVAFVTFRSMKAMELVL